MHLVSVFFSFFLSLIAMMSAPYYYSGFDTSKHTQFYTRISIFTKKYTTTLRPIYFMKTFITKTVFRNEI